ncbi:Uncharacterized RNA methyltransferase CC_1326 [Rhodovastum atsumiense]|uniref:Class I SAM-dependent RNA methyltransferase n=1 Tax=Rhodovastum atsumiense TaxID=504468 RepID=A0A5M6IXP0_9PROT|nr:RsmD family RNA methyltransferase [Rhodovastum atsumiense]KAA5613116.1 class I SAM-dependent RNA methyltransferase [Rhodovastum atsumiense]CAH2600013.1 Uncharacterized RNA methyltransferase CC_1326 [Rhodovastum atsumiense]
MGADGDGIAALADGTPLYLPGTLPGEHVHAHAIAARGEGWACGVDAVVAPSPDRVPPPCPHFGTCGGCTLQHWRQDAYLAWKAGLLATSLRGTAPPAPVAVTPPGTRRRMDLALRRRGAGVVVGLHAPRSTEVIDLEGCAVLHPGLAGLLPRLRELLRATTVLRREGSAIVNLLDDGPDLLLRTDAPPSSADRTKLAAFAQAHGLPRISWAAGNGVPETVCLLRPARITLAGVAVQPPPGAFLQASESGEAAIVQAVLAGLPPRLPARARVAELYAGCGTLTFALARQVRVAAYEGDAAAAGALHNAVNANGLAGRVSVDIRDLVRRPLLETELGGFAAVVLDPPYAGAAAQIARIAAARVARVIYVSCNPAALAQDARSLQAAGYQVLSAVPVDQFLWSTRLESVVTFARV